jgi:LuxR family maltose regulon positive regulatory protein
MARVLIAQADYERALGLLERLQATASASGRVGSVIEILGLQAVALDALRNEPAALAALERALRLAEPEGFVRTFVNAGPRMAVLLRQVLARGSTRAYAEHLLSAFAPVDTQSGTADGQVPRAGPTRGAAPAPGAAVTPSLEPVTERELQVLRLLAAGASNAEVARELIVEQSTVKTHLIHLYGKLGVHSRTQAVARARALQLLD